MSFASLETTFDGRASNRRMSVHIATLPAGGTPRRAAGGGREHEPALLLVSCADGIARRICRRLRSVGAMSGWLVMWTPWQTTGPKGVGDAHVQPRQHTPGSRPYPSTRMLC